MTIPPAMAAESTSGTEGARIYHLVTAAFNVRSSQPGQPGTVGPVTAVPRRRWAFGLLAQNGISPGAMVTSGQVVLAQVVVLLPS